MLINLILQSAFLFAQTGSWDLIAIKSAVVFGLDFFQVNDCKTVLFNTRLIRPVGYGIAHKIVHKLDEVIPIICIIQFAHSINKLLIT